MRAPRVARSPVLTLQVRKKELGSLRLSCEGGPAAGLSLKALELLSERVEVFELPGMLQALQILEMVKVKDSRFRRPLDENHRRT